MPLYSTELFAVFFFFFFERCCDNCTKVFATPSHFSMVNVLILTISQQQLQLSIKYSKFFQKNNSRRLLLQRYFRTATFSTELHFQSIQFSLDFYQGIIVFRNNFYLGNLFEALSFKGKMFFSKSICKLKFVHFLKQCAILFEERDCGRPFILSKVLLLLKDQLEPSILSGRMFFFKEWVKSSFLFKASVFIATTSCSNSFLHGLYGTTDTA